MYIQSSENISRFLNETGKSKLYIGHQIGEVAWLCPCKEFPTCGIEHIKLLRLQNKFQLKLTWEFLGDNQHKEVLLIFAP